jgi:hypothetical protein
MVKRGSHTLNNHLDDHKVSKESVPQKNTVDSIDPRELISELNKLLAAERAGAHSAVACLPFAHTDALRLQLKQLHRQEVSSCKALLECLLYLNAEPDQIVGDFFHKVVALETLEKRMRLIDAGQRRVLRYVEHLLLQVDDKFIRHHLDIVRSYHDPKTDTAYDDKKRVLFQDHN